MAKITLDFETRSLLSLTDSGNWIYSKHNSTSVLCLSYYFSDEPLDLDHVYLWHCRHPSCGIEESPEPIRLFEAIARGDIVEAHNASFEWAIWNNQMVKKYGWPTFNLSQLSCTAARAATLALPRALEDVAQVMRLPQTKDMEGNAIMKMLCKPQKVTAAKRKQLLKQGVDPDQLIWLESKELIERNWEYCRQDTLVEAMLDKALPELTPLEREVYLLDQKINTRGFKVDKKGLLAALEFIEYTTSKLIDECKQLTDGIAPTQRAKMLAWFNSMGVPLLNTQAAHVDTFLPMKDLPPAAHRALEIMTAVNRTSTAKYRTLKEYLDLEDCRVRNTLMYHGASTGRWTGSGPQPHNFPRGHIKNMDLLWEDIIDAAKNNDWEWIEMLYGDPMELLSHGARGVITASEDSELFVADFSAIEARVLLWLADEQEALNLFREGKCIYCDMASAIYGFEVIKSKHPDQRMIGKKAILGLGYGMGAEKFQLTVLKDTGIELSLELCQTIVKTYRKKYAKVPEWWNKMEQCAIEAVRNPGRVQRYGRIQWRYSGRYLQCKLPSGRYLTYIDPVIVSKETPWGEKRDVLSFMAVDPKTKQWWRQTTYGGAIIENIIQAIARDIMALAMLNAERAGFDVLLTVHDEVIAEAKKILERSIDEFVLLMLVDEKWTKGCPVNAEGWRGFRYKKG